MRRVEPGALALSALAGASAWISLGTIAVIDQRAVRIGALPSPLWLPAIVVACVLFAVALRLRTSESWPLSLSALVWLPWLPWTVPAALIWEGRLEWIVWLVAIAGVVIARGPAQRAAGRAWLRDPSRAPWVVSAAFFACSVAAGIQLQAYIPGGDEPHYLVITQSLLYDGDLAIENNHERGDFFEYIETPIRPDFLRRGVNGKIYSVHAPGVSALLAPAYAVAGYPGALVLVSLLTALAAAAMWRLAFELTADWSAAWAATLAVPFGATYFLSSFTIFPDPAGGAAVAAALLVLVGLHTSPAAVTTRKVALAGAALATLPWLHTRFALVAGLFGVVMAARLWPRRSHLAAFATVPVVSAIAWFAFFFAIYGTPNPAAPYGNSRQNTLEWVPAGLAGLIFDQQFGLIANAPALVCVPLGAIAMWRRHRRLAVELLAIAVPYVFVVASFGMWWGGWSAPARFLTCLMPLAVPFAAFAWNVGAPGARALFVALTGVGAANVLARIVVERGALLYNARDGFDLLLDWASRAVNLPLAFPSVHRLGIEPSLLLGSIWLVAGAVALVVLMFLLNTVPRPLGVRWSITAWVVVVCSTVAMSASWRASRTQPLTPESSKIDFVHRWNPDTRPMAVRLASGRVAAIQTALGQIELRSSERARDAAEGPSLLTLARVPAGLYDVTVEGASELRGTLTASVGTTSQTIEQWTLEGQRPGVTTLQLRLPTRVHSIAVRSDEGARSVVRRVGLRPVEVARNDESGRYALRAARYGRVRAFFLDDAIYMEPGGAWTRGDAHAEVVTATDDGGPAAVDVTAGPVATVVEISTQTTTERVALAAGERRRLQLPPGLWNLRTEGRFRPKDYDPGSPDARPLGARIEFPQ